MAVKANFKPSDIRKKLDAFLEVVEKKQIERLQYLGEMCVKHARLIPKNVGFEDQTGNLRSSIGYMVFKDGMAIKGSYTQVEGGSEGVQDGEALARKVGSKSKDNKIMLVVTAGMNYAVHVESKGRDVLTSAENLAKQELPKMIERLVSNINKASQ